MKEQEIIKTLGLEDASESVKNIAITAYLHGYNDAAKEFNDLIKASK